MGPLVARVEPYALVGLSPGTHLGMPSAHLTLVLTLDAPLELSGGPMGPDRHRLRVSLAGLHTTPVSIHHEGRMRGIQLALTPAGCRALLACPAGELAERVVEGADVLGRLADDLRDRLHEAVDADEQVRLVAAGLGRRAALEPMDPRLARAWERLAHSHGRVTIAELADAAGWSRRHFTQRFTAEFGQGPKVVAGLLRFGRSREMVRRGTPAVEVAQRCGYADQSHLVREWRRHTGTTPGRWAGEDDIAFVQDRTGEAGAS